MLLLAQQRRERIGGIDVVVHDQNPLGTAGAEDDRLRRPGGGDLEYRERDDELAPGLRTVALRLDGAAVQLDQAAHQREADPQPTLGAVE